MSLGGAAHAAGPAFDCGKVEQGSIEEMICRDEGLAAADRRLALVYAEALKKAGDGHPPVLKAEQRGWIEGRDDAGRPTTGGPASPTPTGCGPPSCRPAIACCRRPARPPISAAASQATR